VSGGEATEARPDRSAPAAAADRPGAVILSGATGFLGGELLVRLLERTRREVVCLVRAQDDEAAAGRLREVIGKLLGDGHPHDGRVQAVAADVERPGLGLSERRADELAERARLVIHSAASVRFDLGLDQARAINVAGTERMLAFAERCQARGGLDGYAHLSTAYVAGHRSGCVLEDELDRGQRHRNAYERSKLEAEGLVRRAADGLPIQVFRPSIIVGDSRTGWTSAFNVLYAPLRAFALGAYPVVPARRRSPVDVVPVDYVADAVVALAGDVHQPGETFHIVAGERATSVDELVHLACSTLKRRPPRLVPAGLRPILMPLVQRRADPKVRLLLEASAPYFDYFAMKLRFDDAHARARLESHNLRVPALRDYFDRLVAYARQARWGRRPIPRVAAMGAAATAGAAGGG
jgi:long-chain acyl-CoA synthetase